MKTSFQKEHDVLQECSLLVFNLHHLLFLVCESALPATDLLVELYRLSLRILEALRATDLLVCFVFAIRQHLLPSHSPQIAPFRKYLRLHH